MDAPLAARMRPQRLDEFAGQGHILGEGRLLRRVIQSDMLSSIILAGPPGTGKTTLAMIIANTTRAGFISLNAVLGGVAEVRAAIKQARDYREFHGRRTILFVDEVHRWNKAQQDALLPWVEEGMVILIGATTQNPFFEVIPALVSRSRIFRLQPLTADDLLAVARRALADREHGYGHYRVEIDDDALRHLVEIADGDARSLLNALQLAVETGPGAFPPSEGGTIHVDRAIAEESIQQKALLYDKDGDWHFDSISAFIKSLRGSDPDAALYWMARMVAGGEDPRYLLRRMLILASEDVGLSDPISLVVIEAAAAAFDRVGMPEGQFFLAQAALHLATAPKSNSTMAFFDALKAVHEEPREEPPTHLKDPSRDAKQLGHGAGYLYPHAYRDHWVAQDYLPVALRGRVFYHPSGQGREAAIRETVERRRELQLAAMSLPDEGDALTWASEQTTGGRWLRRISESRRDLLSTVRDRLFEAADIARHHRVLVCGAGVWLLLWEALRRAPEGGVVGLFRDREELERARFYAERLSEVERPYLDRLDEAGTSVVGPLPSSTARFERIVGRNLLLRSPDRGALLTASCERLSEGGRLLLAETVPSRCSRLSALAAADRGLRRWVDPLRAIEEEIYGDPSHPLLGWDETTLSDMLGATGLTDASCDLRLYPDTRRIEEAQLRGWLVDGDGEYARAAARVCTEEERGRLFAALRAPLCSQPIEWRVAIALLVGRRA